MTTTTTTTKDHAPSGASADLQPRRVLILGANGPSGRRTVQQALDRQLEVAALTRNPGSFPLTHPRLHVIGGDATNPQTIERALAGCDAVISVIGAAFTLRPVEVYSVSARLVVAEMERLGQRRLLVVTSMGVELPDSAKGGLVQRLGYTLFRRVIGRTVYGDMEKMEAIVRASTLDWTIVRPPGLSNEPGPGYAVAENYITGPFCSRDDLARMLLDQLNDERFVRRVVAVTSPGMQVSAIQMFREEILKR